MEADDYINPRAWRKARQALTSEYYTHPHAAPTPPAALITSPVCLSSVASSKRLPNALFAATKSPTKRAHHFWVSQTSDNTKPDRTPNHPPVASDMVYERRPLKRFSANQEASFELSRSPSRFARVRKAKSSNIPRRPVDIVTDPKLLEGISKKTKRQSHVIRRVNVPIMADKRTRRKLGTLYFKKARSNPSLLVASHSSKRYNRHSPRAFSLLTLQEYLHERSHLAAAHDLNSIKECESYMDSSQFSHSMDRSTDTMPLLSSDLQASYIRKPRQATPTAGYSIKAPIYTNFRSKASQTHVHVQKLEYPYAFSAKEEMVDDDDEINDAPSVKGHYGCVPWHNVSCGPQRYKKKRIIMDLAGRSFACGFPVSRSSRRHNRKSRMARPDTAQIRPFTKSATSQRYSTSSNCASETAPLLTDAGAYDHHSYSHSYPACESPANISGGKMQLTGNREMKDRMQREILFNQQSGSTQYGGMHRRNQPHGKTRRRKVSKSIFRDMNGDNDSDGFHCSHRPMKGRGKIHGSTAGESREKHRSLSQKYRPRFFEEMVGQGMVAQALSNAVVRGKIAPVYLFQGPRGTGKTLAARIFAASMNCSSKHRGAMTRPCGFCRHCESLSLGKTCDVKEVDAAGNNGIDSMRSLLRLISMCPQYSKYKVFIIDECHMLKREAWNLFLNILEEPPRYVVFILITTDSDQLPRTVVSRCLKFPFPKIKDADILFRLQKISKMERIDIEWDALQLITSRSDGSMRDAETTLDQLSNLGQKITTTMVREMAGLIPDEKLVELLELALSADSVNTVRSIREIIESGVEPLALMSQLANLITDLLAGNFNHMSAENTSKSFCFSGHHLSKQELEKLRQALRILSEAEKQLRSCNNRATWLTAALLQFSPLDSLNHHHHPHRHLSIQPSALGTSVTQSPMALLDTSEKETADFPCSSNINTATVKPPWDRPYQWQEEEEEEERVLQISSMEKSERPSAKHTDLRHNNSMISSTLDGSLVADYGVYYPKPSPPRKDIGVATESLMLAPPIITDYSCGKYPRDNTLNDKDLTTDDIWRKILGGTNSSVLRQVLCGQGKLLSLSVSEAYAVAHLEFRLMEEKLRAERAKSSISNALQMALGCPVEVKLSLASCQEEIKDRDKGLKSNNSSCNGPVEKPLISHKKYRRRKANIRPNWCRNQGFLMAKYYSKHGNSSNSSISHMFMDNYPHTKGHHMIRDSSSDESFTNWVFQKSDNPTYCTQDPQKTRPTHTSAKIKPHSRRDQRQNEPDFERDIGYPSNALHANGLVEEEGDDVSVDDYRQDLLYDNHNASLRVERDSAGFDSTYSQSFNEHELDYDRNSMTPAFGTGYLCWKGHSKKATQEAKVKQHKQRRRKRKTTPLLSFVPCAHANSKS